MAKIISVHSFRGGTGKSNTTANLTALIAQSGKRVGVIDTDIQSPGIHVLFNLDEERMDKSLNDYLWGKCGIEEAAYDCSPTLKMGNGEVAVMSGGMYLIPSSIKAGDIARILRETADLYMQHALGELDSAAVIAAVGRGVKRPWVALLPGAQVSVDCPETYGLQAVPPRSAEIQPPPMCIPAPAAVFAPRGPFVDPDPTAEFVLELERIPHLAAFPELDRIFGPDEPPHVALKPLPSPKPTPRALPRPKRAPPENVGAGVPAAPAPAPAPAEADPFAHEDDAREFSLPELRAEAEATPEDYSNVVVPADSESAEEDIPVLEVIEDAIPAGRPLSARRTPPPQGEEAPCVGSPGHADDEPAERDRSTTIRRREPAAGGRPAEKPDAAGSSSARPAHPARPVPSVRGDDDATLIRRKGGLSGTILLVESVDRVDRAFRQNLVDSPFRVATSVKSVDAALEEYLNLRPAVVVVDVLAYGASGANGIPSFVQRFLQVDPHCKIAVLTSAQTKALASESIRQGARMRIEIPLERCALLEALSRTAASRSGVEALRVPTLELKRPVACSWKALENGLSDMMGSWHPFVARVLDPMGLDANLDGDLQVGRAVRINIEIPGVAKPLHTLAEVVSCKEDRVFHHYTIRFSFLKLTSEAKDRLVNFLMEAISRARVQMQGLGRAVS